MKKRWIQIITGVFVLQLLFTHSVFAFTDVKASIAEDEIMSLKKRGIVNGFSEDEFLPEKSLTYAEGVHLIVKSLNLNTENLKFIKAPSTADYYEKISDGKWYSDSFITAHLNEIPVPKNISAQETLTKEQFAHLLFQAIMTQSEFAFIELWVNIADEAKVESDFMGSIQKLLIAEIAALDNGYFQPKEKIQRDEAALWIYRSLEFLKENKKRMFGII